MIQFNVRIFSPPGKRDEIARALRRSISRIRAERGCCSCYLYQDLEDEQTLGFVELWNDPADLQRHASTDFFRELLVWLELSTDPPDISFQSVNAQCGVTYLASLCWLGGREALRDRINGWGPPVVGHCRGRETPDDSCPLDRRRRPCCCTDQEGAS